MFSKAIVLGREGAGAKLCSWQTISKGVEGGDGGGGSGEGAKLCR